MNLVLFEFEEICPASRLVVEGRRARHMIEVLRVSQGDCVRIGQIAGGMGVARVEAVQPGAVELSVEELNAPEPQLEIDLLLALPRPQSLKKVLELRVRWA